MTRSQIIAAGVHEGVLQSRTTWATYAAAVVDHYHANVPVEERVVEFHVGSTADAAHRASRLNTQTVKRILSGEISMRVDLEESLIAALPEPWRNKLLRRLLERQGLLLARLPAAPDDPIGQVRSACALMHKSASAVERVAPMLEDHVICPEDAPHFGAALDALNAVIGACITISTQITNTIDHMRDTVRAGQGRAH